MDKVSRFISGILKSPDISTFGMLDLEELINRWTDQVLLDLLLCSLGDDPS